MEARQTSAAQEVMEGDEGPKCLPGASGSRPRSFILPVALTLSTVAVFQGCGLGGRWSPSFRAAGPWSRRTEQRPLSWPRTRSPFLLLLVLVCQSLSFVAGSGDPGLGASHGQVRSHGNGPPGRARDGQGSGPSGACVLGLRAWVAGGAGVRLGVTLETFVPRTLCRSVSWTPRKRGAGGRGPRPTLPPHLLPSRFVGAGASSLSPCSSSASSSAPLSLPAPALFLQ